MEIVRDPRQIPELFKIEITALMDLKEWGVIITDNQIIVFRRGYGEEWENHPVNTETVLYRAFPEAPFEQIKEKYLNRIVSIVCTPLEMFIVRVPEESNLSTDQHNSVLKFLESMKGTDLGNDMTFWGTAIPFHIGDRRTEDTLDDAIEIIKSMNPQFSELDSSEVIIGIPTAEYLYDEQKSKPRT